MVKSGLTLETLVDVDTVLFDKTGTLTNSELLVEEVFSHEDSTEQIIAYAAAAQGNMSHPVAEALTQKARELGVTLPQLDSSEYQIGFGVSAMIDGGSIEVGSERFMMLKGIAISDVFTHALAEGNRRGHSFVMVSRDKRILGIIELRSMVRDEVSDLVAQLRLHGVKQMAIVSGDREETTRYLAKQLGMDNYFHNVLPVEKADIVMRLQRKGKKVCFIGDGINDAIAMRTADVSVSLAGASSIATDVADAILMDGGLHHLGQLFSISRELDHNLNRSLKILMIPAAVIIPGAMLFSIGFGSALMIKNIVFLGGLGKVVWPLYRDANIESHQGEPLSLTTNAISPPSPNGMEAMGNTDSGENGKFIARSSAPL